MKKLTFLISIVLLFGLTAMVPFDQFSSTSGIQKHTNFSVSIHNSQVEKGMITIKLKKDLKVIPAQRGKVVFNIKTLDQLSEQYQLSGIGKRFRYNSEKLKGELPDLSRIYRITFSNKHAPQIVARAFARDSAIEYAEPIPVIHPCEVPNDPYYNFQHFLPQIQAEEAWEIHKGEEGSEEVVIGVVDTGVDWDHEDLQANAWQNLGEDADGDGQVFEFDGTNWVFDPDDENGIDDDGNGFVDDFTGWNYYYETNDPTPVDYDEAWDHGTHCAGLAAAVTDNGIGVAGISWNVKFMSLHISNPEGTLPFAYDGLIYAAENGAEIITNSWGGYTYSSANLEAIQYARGLGSIIVGGAGNDNQYALFYPASYPDVISVAAVTQNDLRTYYSNYGPNISISSPGGVGSAQGLYSTVPNNSYNWKAGTSMATPVCAGLLGLVQSYHPEWTDEEVIIQVLGTADNIDPMNPNYTQQLGTGRINAFRALDETGVSLAAEIKMELIQVVAFDLDGDNILSPGDTLSFNMKLQNFSLGGCDPAAAFHLGCTDPHINIIGATHSDTIPPDNYFSLTNAFQVVIDEDAETHDVEFCLTTESTIPIAYGDTLTFETLVAPEGICIYRGEGTGNAYSGQYIQNFLANQGIDSYYTTNMPDHMLGFDVVFMSLGNYGVNIDNGTWITDVMAESIIEYLSTGGNLYLGCGSFFGLLNYVESPYVPELKQLLSIDTVITPEIANPIDSLSGLSGSIAEGLYFTGTNQMPYWYIDILTPNENGISMLNEDDYGVVAVQGEGAFGQKTVMMNYAISKLQAGEPGMTPELMERICEFLGIAIVGEEEMVQGSGWKVQGYPNPTSSLYSIEVSLEQPEEVSVQLYDLMGKSTGSSITQTIASGDRLRLDLSDLRPGIYFCNIRIGSETVTKKIIKN